MHKRILYLLLILFSVSSCTGSRQKTAENARVGTEPLAEALVSAYRKNDKKLVRALAVRLTDLHELMATRPDQGGLQNSEAAQLTQEKLDANVDEQLARVRTCPGVDWKSLTLQGLKAVGDPIGMSEKAKVQTFELKLMDAGKPYMHKVQLLEYNQQWFLMDILEMEPIK